MRGIANHDRVDAALYQDHETEDARKVRERGFFSFSVGVRVRALFVHRPPPLFLIPSPAAPK